MVPFLAKSLEQNQRPVCALIRLIRGGHCPKIAVILRSDASTGDSIGRRRMNNGKKPTNERAFLARGISRTFLRDVKAITFGLCIGVILGVIGAYLLGLSAQFGLKFGALVGAFIALSARSHLSRLFDYEHPPHDKDSDP
jgi:hypothetical protein